MKKILLLLLLTLGFTLSSQASTQNQNAKAMPEASIKKMDRQMKKHKAVKRNFRTQKEFKRTQKRVPTHKNSQNKTTKNMSFGANRHNNGYGYDRERYHDDYRPIRQRGHTRSKRGWFLAYRYDRASFYDNEGFYYGFFNRHGYYFEDIFYRYDRRYTFRDRVRGRGLFDRRYYMPVNSQYYGFSSPGEQRRSHTRGFDKY